ncbi:MAG: GNAT family N-acetyltransferase, partial [Desulfatiglandales bacterium]
MLLDKAGRPFFITEGDLSFLDPLLHMYFCFTPRPNIQGLPPKDQKSCETWAAGLLSKGINIIALRPDNTVIGHVSLLPSLDLRDAEYMIFVHQGHRLLGIGTQLTLQAIDKARSLGIKRLWLCVSSTNIP